MCRISETGFGNGEAGARMQVPPQIFPHAGQNWPKLHQQILLGGQEHAQKTHQPVQPGVPLMQGGAQPPIIPLIKVTPPIVVVSVPDCPGLLGFETVTVAKLPFVGVTENTPVGLTLHVT